MYMNEYNKVPIDCVSGECSKHRKRLLDTNLEYAQGIKFYRSAMYISWIMLAIALTFVVFTRANNEPLDPGYDLKITGRSNVG